VLYHLLAGKPPFDGENHIQTLFKLSRGTQPPPLPPTVPEPVAAVVHRALSHSPEARHATAADLQEAIERAMVEAGLITTAAQVAVFMADLMRDRAERRRESIALGLKAADEREKLVDMLQRNAETTATGSESWAGSRSAPGGPESQKSRSGTIRHSAMAVPMIESERAGGASRRRGRTFAVIAGAMAVVAVSVVATKAGRVSRPGAPGTTTTQAPSASAPAASTATPSASASAAATGVDATSSTSAAAISPLPAVRPTVRRMPAPVPAPKSTATVKRRSDDGF
jgi:serine/threonine-protein kinase